MKKVIIWLTKTFKDDIFDSIIFFWSGCEFTKQNKAIYISKWNELCNTAFMIFLYWDLMRCLWPLSLNGWVEFRNCRLDVLVSIYLKFNRIEYTEIWDLPFVWIYVHFMPGIAWRTAMSCVLKKLISPYTPIQYKTLHEHIFQIFNQYSFKSNTQSAILFERSCGMG